MQESDQQRHPRNNNPIYQTLIIDANQVSFDKESQRGRSCWRYPHAGDRSKGN